ncbi:MAG: MFS transporter [Ilumatobacteraceae bacterium]
MKKSKTKLPRDVYRVATARLISEIGDEMVFIALLFRVKDSGTWAVAALFACGALSRVLLSPVAGYLVDKFPTRSLIRVVAIVMAGASVALIPARGPALYALVVVLGIGQAIVMPAWAAYVPVLVEKELLPQAYAVIQTYRSIAIVAGAGLGGFIVGIIGSTAAFLIDASTFLAVAAITIGLVTERAARGDSTEKIKAMAGFSAIRKSQVLMALVIMLTVFNTCIGVVEVSGVFLIADILGGGPVAFGIMSLLFGLTMLIVGRLVSKYKTERSHTSIVIAAAVCASLGVLVYAASPNLWVAGLANVVIGIGMAGLNIFVMPIIVEHSNQEERGRVHAVMGAFTTAGFGIALAISSVAGGVFSARTVIASGGVACLASLVFSGPRLKRNVASVLHPAKRDMK